MEFNEIVTYPTQGEDWLKTTLIGGALIFLGFLFIPLLFVYGYIVRVIRGSLANDSVPPAFDDWGELLVDGVQAWIISVVYLIVPLIVAAITVGGSFTAIATGGEVGAVVGTSSLILGFTASALLSLVFAYLAVIALVNFTREGRFGAAFEFDLIKTVALDREYAIPWLVSVGVFIAVSLVGMIPFLGWVLTPFVTFYAAIIAGNLWANGFAQAMESVDGVAQLGEEEALV